MISIYSYFFIYFVCLPNYIEFWCQESVVSEISRPLDPRKEVMGIEISVTFATLNSLLNVWRFASHSLPLCHLRICLSLTHTDLESILTTIFSRTCKSWLYIFLAFHSHCNFSVHYCFMFRWSQKLFELCQIISYQLPFILHVLFLFFSSIITRSQKSSQNLNLFFQWHH